MHSELLARLEAATGPDRELDALILLAVNGYTLHENTDPKDGVFAFWEGEPWNSICHNCTRWPEVTASIDAALTLVENRAPKAIFDVLRTAAICWTQSGSTDISDLPRFIVIAALRAKGEA